MIFFDADWAETPTGMSVSVNEEPLGELTLDDSCKTIELHNLRFGEGVNDITFTFDSDISSVWLGDVRFIDDDSFVKN
jgi:hypothetical protein